ncbi:MAG: hypothetical protein R3D43_02055 [Tepidamorphaceae bacterium]|nr:hypothetical protein [Rhodobiaceae bacterium]
MKSSILKFIVPAIAGIAICFVSLSAPAVAGGISMASDLDTAAKLSPCAERSLSAVTQPLADRTAEPPREIELAHGTWHPCANDANACGAGHSCCEGHCVKGACGD